MDARVRQLLRVTTRAMTGKFPNGLGSAMLRAGKGPTELGRAIGVTKQDVSRWAKQERKLPPTMANKLASLLNTTASELLLLTQEQGSEFKTVVALAGYVGAGGQIDLSSEQADPDMDQEAGVYADIPDAAIAYEVLGESMRPRFLAGNLVICANRTQEFESLIGEEVVVGAKDGARFLKILHPGSRRGLFHLESHNAPLILDAQIEWAAEIVAIIPSRKWRKMRRSNLPMDWSTVS